MEIKTTNSIRQHQPGQFMRPEDGKRPYAHINDQKLESKREQYKSAVYVNNKNVVSLEKEIASNSLKIFDSDVGLKVSTEKLSETKTEKRLDLQYDKTGKTQITTAKEERRIDQRV